MDGGQRRKVPFTIVKVEGVRLEFSNGAPPLAFRRGIHRRMIRALRRDESVPQ